MITRGFIEKVHDAFDELNYHESKQLDFDKFGQSAVKVLTHCKELTDAIDAVRMYQFCLKKWSKIERMFKRKLHLFNEYEYEGNSLISIVSDEEALGTYYITNGINRKVKDIFVASHSFDEEMFALGFGNGRFAVYEDGNYYIKYSRMSATKMKLFDNKNNCLCNIVLSQGLGIFLENNVTSYELVVYDEAVGIYDRSYIDNLGDADDIDTEKLLADIEWDILDKNSNLGVAKLNIYASDQDMEMLLLFAASTFLVFQKYMQAQKSQYAMMSFWASR
ncbi:MAG: hypothetical protein K2O39_04900 [Clostridiales bacterium]|nr:hypothetical protein [Clostridiales bacterium]